MTPKTLVIDLGSTYFKGTIYQGVKAITPVALSRVETKHSGSHAEIIPAALDRAMARLLSQFGSQLSKVDQVILSNQSPSLTVLSKTGGLLCPVITHMDRRSHEEAKFLLDAFGKEHWLSVTGNLPYAGGIAATSILWLKRNHNRLFRQAMGFGCLNTFFVNRWTGDSNMDPANAAFMGLYNTVSGEGWNETLCDFLEISVDKLPKVRQANEISGALKKNVAKNLGLRSGIPVFVGTMDTSAAAMANELEEGDLLHVSGTSDVLATLMKTPKVSEKYLTRGLGVGKAWLAVRTIPAGGATLKWCEEVLGANRNEHFFNKREYKTPVTFDPYLGGDRLSVEKRTGAFKNLTLASSKQDLVGAVMNALRKQSVEAIKVLSSVHRLSGRVWFTGGNLDFSQWLHWCWKYEVQKRWKFSYDPNMGLKGLARIAVAGEGV